MRLSLDEAGLSEYVAAQLTAFFPDGPATAGQVRAAVGDALERIDYTFSRIRLTYYFERGESCFNHLNTDQYASFLYFFSSSLHRNGGDPVLAEKAYALNKALHGVDLFYEISLPDVFLLQHPVGTVLGRARYGDFLCVYNNVTVGSDLDGNYPILGAGVVMFSGSRVIGTSRIADNCWIAPGAVVLDTDVPGDSVVFGMPPDAAHKPSRRRVIQDFFGYQE